MFFPYDLVHGDLITAPTASCFMPVYAGAADEAQAEKLYTRLDPLSFCALQQGSCFTIGNYDMHCDDFNSRNYWRGPVWININRMLSRGLKHCGDRERRTG